MNLIGEKLNACTTIQQLVELLTEVTRNPEKYFKQRRVYDHEGTTIGTTIYDLIKAKAFEYKIRNKLIVLDIELPQSGDDPLRNLQLILQTLKQTKSKPDEQLKKIPKIPKMEKKYIKAHELYQKALESRKVFEDNDGKDVYQYIREVIDPKYKPKFESWRDYLDRYLRIEHKIRDEIRTN